MQLAFGGAGLDRARVTVLSVVDDVDVDALRAALHRRTVGIDVAPCSVSSSMRTLTNWFGNSSSSSFANCALSLTVPVVDVDLVVDASASVPSRA